MLLACEVLFKVQEMQIVYSKSFISQVPKLFCDHCSLRNIQEILKVVCSHILKYSSYTLEIVDHLDWHESGVDQHDKRLMNRSGLDHWWLQINHSRIPFLNEVLLEEVWCELHDIQSKPLCEELIYLSKSLFLSTVYIWFFFDYVFSELGEEIISLHLLLAVLNQDWVACFPESLKIQLKVE